MEVLGIVLLTYLLLDLIFEKIKGNHFSASNWTKSIKTVINLPLLTWILLSFFNLTHSFYEIRTHEPKWITVDWIFNLHNTCFWQYQSLANKIASSILYFSSFFFILSHFLIKWWYLIRKYVKVHRRLWFSILINVHLKLAVTIPYYLKK